MNYNELQNACERRKMQIKEVTDVLGMTYTGLRDALNRDTLPAKKIVPLCHLLKITPNEFLKFGESSHTNYEQIGISNTQNVGIIEIDILKEQLEKKDAQIDKLLNLLNK